MAFDWERVDLRGNRLTVYIGKVRRWKHVLLHPRVRAELVKVAPEKRAGHVFSYRSRWAVYRALKPLLDRLGIGFTPHMARHDFGGRHREGGRTGRDLVDLSTWTSERSTERYRDAGDDYLRQVVADYDLGETATESVSAEYKTNK